MNMHNSLSCIYYNLLSNFYICLNLVFPYYNEEILHLQYKSIEQINENVYFVNNTRKRKRFNLFIENLIQKNNELLEMIKKQEEEDNNISNYEKINVQDDEDIEDNDDEEESSDQENDDDDQENDNDDQENDDDDQENDNDDQENDDDDQEICEEVQEIHEEIQEIHEVDINKVQDVEEIFDNQDKKNN
jgi:hypothetical protein